MEPNSNRLLYESTLVGILQNEGKIEPFLNVIFGFLYNCTDFYRILRTPKDKIGFPPGVAEKVVLNVFKKYQKLAADDDKCRSDEKTPLYEGDIIPKPCEIVEIETNSGEDKRQLNESELKDSIQPEKAEASNADEEEEETEESRNLKLEQKVYQDQSDSYNGAIRDNYKWSQNIQEIDVYVTVPKHITKGKLVKVDMKHKHLTVSTTNNGQETVLMDGELCWKINIENSCWTLQPGEAVHINLDKVQERWWDSLLTDEPKINIRNIDASRPMEDLGDEEQAKIHELMFNEQQKRMGKITTDQMKIENLLKEAWDKEGSPFKGQPFDPSVVNMTTGADFQFNQK